MIIVCYSIAMESPIQSACLMIHFVTDLHFSSATSTVVSGAEDWYRNIEAYCQDIFAYNTSHSYHKEVFVSSVWRQWFNWHVEQRKQQKSTAMYKMLVYVMIGTVKAMLSAGYECEDGTQVTLAKRDLESISSIIYNKDHKYKLPKVQSSKDPTIEVFNNDCNDVALYLLSQGYNPVALNMASATSAGGGYKLGHWAQEESLFRRSNYYMGLDDPPRIPYPLPEFGGVYTSPVIVFRGNERDGYPLLKVPFRMSYIAVAAYKDPPRNPKDQSVMDDTATANTRRKIRAIFAIAAENGHDTIVLGALGCGSLKNPPAQVASLFYEVSQEYKYYFKRIAFAIIDDHNAFQNRTGNLYPFLERFRVPVKVLKGNVVSETPVSFPTEGEKVPTNRPQSFYQPSTPVSYPQHVPQQTQYVHQSTPQISSPIPQTSPVTQYMAQPMQVYQAAECVYGAICTLLGDTWHASQYRHPTTHCSFGGMCQERNDIQHSKQFIHPPLCKDGALCTDIDNTTHAITFCHPDKCSSWGKCSKWSDKDHMKKFRHPSACPYNNACPKSNEAHMLEFLHTTTSPTSLLDNQGIIDLKDVAVGAEIGVGHFGGTWQGTEVACKRMKAGSIADLMREVRLMKSVEHPNVVRCFGVYTDKTGDICIIQNSRSLTDEDMITELCRGSAIDIVSRASLSMYDKISMAADAARGMSYLATRGIIHADLGLRNILIGYGETKTSKYPAKVADFGLSKLLQSPDDYYQKDLAKDLPIRWSSPEVLEYGKYSLPSDVWSFGVMMWELMTNGKRPFYDLLTNREVVRAVVDGEMLPQLTIPDQVYSVMRSCWARNPKERPTFPTLIAKLDELRPMFQHNEQQVQVATTSTPTITATTTTKELVGYAVVPRFPENYKADYHN